MDLRCTFGGLPEYKLESRLKGLHDVRGWHTGWLHMPENIGNV